MRNVHAFEKHKSTLQGILLIVVSCTGVPHSPGTCLPSSLPPGNVREGEFELPFLQLWDGKKWDSEN